VATSISPVDLLNPDLPEGFLDLMVEELRKMNEATSK
jgi:hypothetical protein